MIRLLQNIFFKKTSFFQPCFFAKKRKQKKNDLQYITSADKKLQKITAHVFFFLNANKAKFLLDLVLR